jgi:hypothetical protein
MLIYPQQSIQEIMTQEVQSRIIFENYGINIEIDTERSLIEIAEARFLQLDAFIEDLNLMLN